jgi:PAS domain S-box-containing protein
MASFQMEDRFDSVPRTTEVLVLGGAILIVALIAGLSYYDWRQLTIHNREAERTRDFIAQANALLSSLKDAETGQRGFLLTGDEAYLDPYRRAVLEIPNDLRVLGDKTPSDPGQQAAVQNIQQLAEQKLSELQQTLDLASRDQRAAALSIVSGGSGKRIMDRLRQLCAEIGQTESQRLVESTQKAQHSENRTRLISTGGSSVLLVFLLGATAIIRRASMRRENLLRTVQVREKEVRAVRDLLETTLLSVGDAVIATDSQGRVTILNGVAESLTGWNAKAAEGRQLDEVFRILNETTRQPVESPVAKVLREGVIVGLANHTILVARDGREMPIDDSAAPIRDENGKIFGVVLTFHNIAERRAAERQLAEQAAALARSNRELEEFAYVACHDMQEPLRIINIYTQMLLKHYGALNGTEEYSRYITESVKRMQTLIRDLLTFSRIVHIEPDEPDLVDATQALQQAISSLQPTMEETLAVVTYDPLPRVQADMSQLIQLFQNLLGNALKYRSETELPRVHFSAKLEEAEWVFSCQDNGIGFEQQHAQRIFGLFKRLHSTNQYPGTGIGLAICKRIVERSGGRIWASSQPLQGSTFYFAFPQRPRAEGVGTNRPAVQTEG